MCYSAMAWHTGGAAQCVIDAVLIKIGVYQLHPDLHHMGRGALPVLLPAGTSTVRSCSFTSLPVACPLAGSAECPIQVGHAHCVSTAGRGAHMPS